MRLKVRLGPWESISEGKFQGHEIESYLNEEETIFSIVYETEKGKRVGALLQFFKIFYAKGNLEGFVDTLPRNVLALNIHSEKLTYKFLILDSGISYSSLKEDEVSEKTDELLEKLEKSSKMVKDVAKAYDLELVELKNSEEAKKQAFYSMPLVNLIVSPVAEKAPAWKEIPSGVGEIILGITKEGNVVKEPLSLFQRAIVSDSKRNSRMLVLRVLLESVLLSKIPIVVIDFNNEFTGLNVPTKEAEELKKYKVGLEPAGFPVKEFKILKDVKVNLQAIDAEGMCEIFGLGENKVSEAVVQLIGSKEGKLIPQIVNAAKRGKIPSNLSKFEQKKVLRVLQLFEHRYPGLLNGENNVEELSKHWAKALGRASIVSFKGRDERESLLLLNSLFNELNGFYKKAKQLNTVIVLPFAEKIFPRGKENKIIKSIQESMLEFEGHGIGFLLETANENELSEAIAANSLALLNVVKGNDVGVQVKGRKSYRVLVRPSLSKLEEVSETIAEEKKHVEEKKKTGLRMIKI